MRKIVLRAAFAAVLALAGGRALSAPPLPSTERGDTLTRDAVRADFTELYDRLQASHFDLYARASRPGYDALHRRMLSEIVSPMSRAEAAARFQRFMAYGRIAHARIDAASAPFNAYRDGGGRVFPLDLRIRGRRAYVAQDAGGAPGLTPGDELLAINGVPMSRWLDGAQAEVSADTPYMLGAMLEWSFPQVVWNATGPVERFDLRLAHGRRTYAATAPARTRAEIAAARAAEPRLAISWEAREARMIGGQIAYLRPGPAYNVEDHAGAMYDNRAYRAFIDQAFEGFLAKDATDLIIDLRDNPGGDSSFSDRMVAWFADRPFRFNSSFRIKVSEATRRSNAARLAEPGNDPTGVSALLDATYRGAKDGQLVPFEIPAVSPRDGRRFQGRVYALINRHSYSNTATVAAIIQDYRFGVIVGEETSDLATTYGAMESFTLPRSGLVVGYPKAQITRPNGSTAARGVTPDILIETPVVETPDDPVLARTVEIVRSR